MPGGGTQIRSRANSAARALLRAAYPLDDVVIPTVGANRVVSVLARTLSMSRCASAAGNPHAKRLEPQMPWDELKPRKFAAFE
jgi:hypothetical protein